MTDYSNLVIDGNWGAAANAAIQNAKMGKLYRVTWKPGVYVASGITLESGITLDAPGVTLIHPNGADSTHILNTKLSQTTGTIAAGDNLLTVTSAVGVEVGSVVGIRAAGGASVYQYGGLVNSINSAATSLVLDDVFGFNSAGFLIIDSEVIQYSGLSGNTFTGLTRGLFGTLATGHQAGAVVALALVHYATVVAINGNVLTLDTPAVFGVTGSRVLWGAKDITVKGLTIDGNKPAQQGAQKPHGAMVQFSRGVRFENCIFKNCAHAGLFDYQGSYDVSLNNCQFENNGYADEQAGADVWAFGGASVDVSNSHFTGGYIGVALDDRTTNSNEHDAQVFNSHIANNNIDAVVGIVVNGVRDSSLIGNRITAPQGVVIYGSKQGTVALPVDNITVDGNTFVNGDPAIEVSTHTTHIVIFPNNVYENCIRQIVDTSGN